MTAVTTWARDAAGPGSLAFTGAATGGATAADALLTWETRSAVEHQAQELADRLTASATARRAVGEATLELAGYHLLFELVNVLRAWEVGRAWRAAGGTPPMRVDGDVPTAVARGLQAALGTPAAGAAWTPIAPVPHPVSPYLTAVRWGIRGLERLRDPRAVRVLAIPALNVGRALQLTDGEPLRAAGVGLALYPALEDRRLVDLARRARLPVVGEALLPPRRRTPPSALATDLPPLHDDPALDAALREVAASVLRVAAPLAARAQQTLRRWERLPELRAVVLPTAAAGFTRTATTWAQARGIAVAVVQHGVYVMREHDGADRRADVVLTWGRGVAGQMEGWSRTPPAEAIGAPGIGARPASTTGGPRELRRLLVATTNSPTGTALGLLRFQTGFLEDIAPAVRALAREGVMVEVRPHPAESAEAYRAWLQQYEIPGTVSAEGGLDAALERADLVISSMSSVAFEAAALGRPVLLWTGRIPQALRAEHLLPPFSERLDGMFDSADDLLGLCSAGPAAALAAGESLSGKLSAFAEPFDAAAFAAALQRLADAPRPARVASRK